MDPILKVMTLVDENELDVMLDELSKTKKAVSLGFLNQHGYNLILQKKEIEDSFLNLDYLLRDGKGIELACRYNKISPKLNLNGTDFIPLLIDRLLKLENKPAFFAYGTSSPWLEKGAQSLFNDSFVHCLDGFQDLPTYKEHYLKNKTNGLDVIVLAMGMPKQEILASMLKAIAVSKTIIICGGAILDFQAGKVRRCPKMFQQLGLEWFYRLLNEPKRLFSRYVIGIPLFFKNVFISKLK
ncbi:WecB/TagA/CpsF family glycosyltransferase [Pseudoalteromonas sp. NSLLW218]|uniref:WecB/TagA/CpsF family glycosyltransferase n=1 Tax=Pseudoalteromonas sp. NSLLW218 TaxID=2792048 RepID=UPI0018CE6C9E|nr:WecB/TagA/CpsF family glycosyltransferase [Pseudoalteromonas sp. NSLLW218]MBH0088502.1 WecB/TagA/CpsF family glycosyltransferase [Pseudoalteromonas sp. NSLLW218]